MKLYKIFTENKDRHELEKRIYQYFDSFTILTGMGQCHGHSEHSIVIEIVTNKESEVYDLAWDIRKLLNQEAVLVVAVPCEMKLVK